MIPKFRPQIGKAIPLGKRGEHLARRIDFGDVLEFFKEAFGGGTAELRYQRPNDTTAYVPSVIDTTDGAFIWKPVNTDLANAGTGRCELRWLVDGRVAKSHVWDVVVEDSIMLDGDNPDEHEYYDGAYVITPTWQVQELETDNKICTDDITVREIQASETENEAGGITLSL